jgi:predicted nicotinamide N-methyase
MAACVSPRASTDHAAEPARVVEKEEEEDFWTRRFTFGSLPPLCIQEHFGAGLGGTVWAGGVKLARYLVDDGGAQRLVDAFPQDVQDLHVLELGAGCSGLPGLVMAQLRLFHSILVTDGDEEAVERLQLNFEDNVAATASCSTRLHAQLLRWGDEADMKAASDFIQCSAVKQQQQQQYHVIVGADVAYRMTAADPGAQAAVDALCMTMRRLLAPGGMVILCQMARPLYDETVLLSALMDEYAITRLDEEQVVVTAAPPPSADDGGPGAEAVAAGVKERYGLGVFMLRRKAQTRHT